MPETVRHIVRQFNWLRAGAAFVRAPGERRIAWFDTVGDAIVDQRRRDLAVRDRHNPFRFGTAWHHLTTMPVAVYRDWLMDDGMEPPAEDVRDLPGWQGWWDALKDSLSADQRQRVWDGLNRLRFHDVIARRPSETAYCVSRIRWDFDDSWYHAGHEGGEPLKLYRTRERAEQERARLEEELRATPRAMVTDWGYFPRDPEQFLNYDHGDIENEAYRASRIDRDAPQYEVLEIDLCGECA